MSHLADCCVKDQSPLKWETTISAFVEIPWLQIRSRNPMASAMAHALAIRMKPVEERIGGKCIR